MAKLTGLCLGAILLISSGCQCYKITDTYGTVIDRIADTKWKLDPLYVPGLDISRTGMPDWNRFGINRYLCPCQQGQCSGRCRARCSVAYPAEYRMKYWAMQAEAEQPDRSIREAGQNEFPETELAPPPEPAPAEPILPELVPSAPPTASGPDA